MNDWPRHLDGSINLFPNYREPGTYFVRPEDFARVLEKVLPEPPVIRDPYKLLTMLRFYCARWNDFNFTERYLKKRA
jgi:hypothetical protein